MHFSNFSKFRPKNKLLETKTIFSRSSLPKGMFWAKIKKWIFLRVSINSRSSEKIAAAVIFLSVIVLSVVFIYFPRVHSEVSRLLNEGKLQKAAHLVAEAIFNKPEKWTWAIDWCFETLHTIANMTAPSTVKISPNDDETARNQRRAKIQAAVHHKDEVSIKGNATNAEHVIKSIRFSSYESKRITSAISKREYQESNSMRPSRK